MTETKRQADIHSALIRLNSLYGKGDIVYVDGFRWTVTVKCPQCTPFKRNFRLVQTGASKVTVKYLGHQQTVLVQGGVV